MKIINSTPRGSSSSIQTTPVSELTLTSQLHESSLLHIVQCINPDNPIDSEKKYESMKITAKSFQQKVYEAVNNTLKCGYWDTHLWNPVKSEPFTSHTEVSPFKEMIEYVSDSSLIEPSRQSDFVEHVNYDFTLLIKYQQKKFAYIDELIKDIYKKINLNDCYFRNEMVITTTKLDNENNVVTVVNESVNHIGTENDTYCQLTIKDGDKISNNWIVPEDGNLVIYGWLDSSEALNNKAIPSSFCVLEGRINGQWEVISVQSVIPAKSITYVGFNVLAHKDLTIRVRTGFTVGAKSGQYSNEQDGFDTLSNITPNGFKCQVYSRQSS